MFLGAPDINVSPGCMVSFAKWRNVWVQCLAQNIKDFLLDSLPFWKFIYLFGCTRSSLGALVVAHELLAVACGILVPWPEIEPWPLALLLRASLLAQRLKHLPEMWETWVWSLGREDPLEKEMATHSRTLASRIPWTEEPDGLQSTGSQRVGHDWATSLSLCFGVWSLSHWTTKEAPDLLL